MLDVKRRKGLFVYHTKWFSQRPNIADALRLVDYRQCACRGPRPGFHKQRFYTVKIDLGDDEQSLLSAFGKNTRYKVSRAGREGVVFAIEEDLARFVSFYNQFAQSKSMAEINTQQFAPILSSLVLTKAMFDDQALVMHAYLVDPRASRVRLLHSASQFRNSTSSEERNFIGRANRFLHYEDMRHFKRKGITLYDLGGYAVNDPDEQRQRINEFKQGFGGELVEEPNYISYPLYFATHFKRWFHD